MSTSYFKDGKIVSGEQIAIEEAAESIKDLQESIAEQNRRLDAIEAYLAPLREQAVPK